MRGAVRFPWLNFAVSSLHAADDRVISRFLSPASCSRAHASSFSADIIPDPSQRRKTHRGTAIAVYIKEERCMDEVCERVSLCDAINRAALKWWGAKGGCEGKIRCQFRELWRMQTSKCNKRGGARREDINLFKWFIGSTRRLIWIWN